MNFRIQPPVEQLERLKPGDVITDKAGAKYTVQQVGMRFLHVLPKGGGELMLLKTTDVLRIPILPKEEPKGEWD